jgi:hypothetical protein
VTLIDDDEVILVDRRDVGGLLCKEYPLQIEDFRERPRTDDLGGAELACGLIAKRIAVNDETDSPKTVSEKRVGLNRYPRRARGGSHVRAGRARPLARAGSINLFSAWHPP